MGSRRIDALIEQYRPGYGLPAGFYTDPDVWSADAEVLEPLWFLAGHTSQIPEPGDTKLVSLFGESVIVVSDTPTDFGAAYQPFEDLFRFYGIADTKVIRVQGFPVTANWKTLVENTIDAYHVPVVHPNFTKTRTPAYWQAAAATRHAEVIAAAAQADREMDEWKAALTQFPDVTGVVVQDGEHDEQFRWLARGPLAPGYQSETIGGKRVGPLMGRFTESDEASVFSNFNPLDSVFMSVDHASIFSIRPLSHDQVYWQTTWLIDKDAQEGRDYDADEVCEFYTEVNAEDFPIWERTYQGATSRADRPGRLAPQESLIGEFQRWYVRRLRQQVDAPEPASA